MISYKFENASYGRVIDGVHVIKDSLRKKYTFIYPCKSTSECTDYIIDLSPGTYLFELYGASGGFRKDAISSFIDKDGVCHKNTFASSKGNVGCNKKGDRGGAGGYISGVISIRKTLRSYATVGGKGDYRYNEKVLSGSPNNYLPKNWVKGGYGGGGHATNWYFRDDFWGTGSGGGQTAVKFEQNDLWHRVIVSGAGGGSDNYSPVPFGNDDDGSGGAGGGLVAQGFWFNGKYDGNRVANSTFGFTFGSGETAQKDGSKNKKYGVPKGDGECDRAGAGSGWFGGFASHNGNAGAGGGSSWALTIDAKIPKGDIEAHDSLYKSLGKKKYAFTQKDKYLFHDVVDIPGIWSGNGKLIITVIEFNHISVDCGPLSHFHFVLMLGFYLDVSF